MQLPENSCRGRSLSCTASGSFWNLFIHEFRFKYLITLKSGSATPNGSLQIAAHYFFWPTWLNSLSLAIWVISPWINSIEARQQSRVAFVSLSSLRLSLPSAAKKYPRLKLDSLCSSFSDKSKIWPVVYSALLNKPELPSVFTQYLFHNESKSFRSKDDLK